MPQKLYALLVSWGVMALAMPTVGSDYAGNRHGASAPVHGASLLLEDGSYLLLEDGSSTLLLE